jgi:hypothetical protein
MPKVKPVLTKRKETNTKEFPATIVTAWLDEMANKGRLPR